MKKHLFLLTTAMIFSIAAAFAQGGTIGPLTWNLKDGVLTISGEGKMPNYEFDFEVPWLQYSGITAAIIENGVTNIGDNAFWECADLTSVTIGDSVKRIGEYAFYLCKKLASVTMGNHVDSICKSAFADCRALTSITLPNSVTSIGNNVFSACSALTSIIIPNGVTSIGQFTFASCEALSSVTIPKSVTSIGIYAFAFCGALTSIINLNPEPVTIDPNVFLHINTIACTLNVPNNAVWAYKHADVWKTFYYIVGGYYVQVNANNNEYGYVEGSKFYPANTAASVTATAFNNYKFVNWTKNGTVVSTDNPYTFTVTKDIELVANFENNVGIEELRMANGELKIYPNPTTGELKIENGELKIESVEISDTYGKNIFNFQFSTFNSIDISHLPAGIYFVKIRTEAGEVVKKVVKE